MNLLDPDKRADIWCQPIGEGGESAVWMTQRRQDGKIVNVTLGRFPTKEAMTVTYRVAAALSLSVVNKS